MSCGGYISCVVWGNARGARWSRCNNWADGGHDGNVHAIKLFRFREHLLYAVPTNGTEERLYLSYEHEDGRKVSVWEEMDALRSALAMAQMRRALILPEFVCGGGQRPICPTRAARCTADAFLDAGAAGCFP